MKRSIKRLCKAASFVLIGLLLFRTANALLIHKNPYPKYRNYKVQEDVDVLILGSSHSDDGINAAQLEAALREAGGTGLNVFNYSVYGMRIEQMYFFLREILKDMPSPDLIVLETYSFLPIADGDREILARRAFDVFPLSRNKIEAIRYCVKEDRLSYYFPIMKYHSRWRSLSLDDVRLVFDRSTWSSAGKSDNQSPTAMDPIDDYFMTDTSQIDEAEAINATQTECFENLLAFARERGIQILLTCVPFKVQFDMDSLHQIRVNNYLRDTYADGASVRLLDMNRLWREMDFGYGDLYNEGHCNASGARKATDVLAKYLIDNYDLSEWGHREA